MLSVRLVCLCSAHVWYVGLRWCALHSLPSSMGCLLPMGPLSGCTYVGI